MNQNGIKIILCLLSYFILIHTVGAEDPSPRLHWMLFKSGDGHYHTYRIPALVKTTQGTLLAFAEGRKNSQVDHGDIDIVCKRSEDNGKTWSKMQILQDNGRHTIGNPCPLVDRETGRIFLLTNGAKHTEGEIINRGKGFRKIYISHSDDDGKTWSERKNISAMVKKPEWRWYATGPCSGIQIQSGKYKGRLVVPANHSYHGSDVKRWEYRCHSLYSDDHGKTWEIGQSSSVGASETQIAEADEDLLIQDIRMQTHKKGVRAVRFSADGGATWSPLAHDKYRKDPRCQGSVIRHGDLLISTNPNSSKREKMTLYVSKDQAKSWQQVALVYPNSSAYSDLEVTDDNQVVCLYENGIKSPYERISLHFMPLDKLLSAGSGKAIP
ncbi:MAG: exo-alpha-sialidase [Opitutae bacterium]|jgi:sialidase-1|nr:exo-alpha-sialidase [Opitutae bacterium]